MEMKRPRMRAVVAGSLAVLALIGVGIGVMVASRRGEAPPARVVLGLGDSVGAGQGLGPSKGYPNNPGAHPALVADRLGYRSYNFAIAGACVATSGSFGADDRTRPSCVTSVLKDQLPKVAGVLPGPPGLIIVTAGANDVGFADCGIALLAPVSFENPCAEPRLTQSLEALRNNMNTLLRALHRTYPDATISTSGYYVPFPAPASSDAQICPAFEPVAALRRPLSLASDRLLRNAARELQASTYAAAAPIVERMNATIRSAAESNDAVFAPVDFTGHDWCGTETGASAEDVWVFGPKVDVSFSVRPETPTQTGRSWKFTLPYACPDTSSDPDDVGTGGTVNKTVLGISVRYSAVLKPNCLAHPTRQGQAQYADSIMSVLPPRFPRR